MAYPPFARPGSPGIATRRADAMPSIEDFLDELPAIDDFIDYGQPELPSIDQFLESGAETWQEPSAATTEEDTEYDADGWAIAGWQSFDWNGAAALGVRTEETAHPADSWDTQEWSSAPLGRSGGSRGGSSEPAPSADEVARALDGIARRIRSGELSIDQLRGTQPEAAMAAALAALLRMRD